MTNNAEREGFERWALTHEDFCDLTRDSQDNYLSIVTARAWNAWQARAQASGVPDGWKLVPVEPTKEMIGSIVPGMTTPEAWDVLLSSAPTPPKAASVPVARLEAFISKHGGNATHACDENEVLASLAELIAEYK